MSAPAYNGQGVRGTESPWSWRHFVTSETNFLTKLSHKFWKFRLKNFVSAGGWTRDHSQNEWGAMAELGPMDPPLITAPCCCSLAYFRHHRYTYPLLHYSHADQITVADFYFSSLCTGGWNGSQDRRSESICYKAHNRLCTVQWYRPTCCYLIETSWYTFA